MVKRIGRRAHDAVVIAHLLFFSGKAQWLHYTCRVTGNRPLPCGASPADILHINIEDAAINREIVKAGELLGIDVQDHIVIGRGKFVSLKERGLGF